MALFFSFDLMTLGVNTMHLAEKLRTQEEHILELLWMNSVTRVFEPFPYFPRIAFTSMKLGEAHTTNRQSKH